MSLLAAVALALVGAQAPTHVVLKPAGAVGFWLSDDLDGDGRGDLVGIGGREVSVFLFGEGGFPEQPTRSFELPADTVFVDLGDADGDRARELCILTPRGALAARVDGADAPAWTPMLAQATEAPAVFAVAPSDIAWNDILRDVDGVGFEDVVLPCADGYRVFLRGSDATTFTRSGVVPIRPTGSFDLGDSNDLGALEQTIDLPRIFIGDVAGDRKPELLTFDGASVRGYSRPDGDAAWPESFSRVLYSGDASLPERIFSARNVRIEALDGDARSTLVVVRSLDGEIDFFSSSDDGALDVKKTLRLDGWILPPKLIDLDGDRRIDLLAPTVARIGALQLVKVFTTRSFSMRYSIFKHRDEVRYARTPDEVRDIEFPLRYETGDRGVRVENQMVYTFDGDFTGDGVKDFVVKASETALAIHAGGAEASFAAKPAFALPVPDMKPYFSVSPNPYDFDRDGRSDLLLHYRAQSGGADQTVVVMNRE